MTLTGGGATTAATGTITDDDAYTISISDGSFTETDANGNQNLVVTMTGEAQADVVLSFTTSNGSAGTSDFTSQSGAAYTLTAGQTSINLPVEILGDEIVEPTESFSGIITLSNANGQQITIADGETNAIIDDDDEAVVASVILPGLTVLKDNEIIELTVNFNNPVTVTGIPQVPITIGGNSELANYVNSKSTSTALHFEYQIQTNDADNDGISIGSKIRLNGGSILDIVDNNADLTINNVENKIVNVDAVYPVIENKPVSSIEIVSTSEIGEQALTITITFNEDMDQITEPVIQFEYDLSDFLTKNSTNSFWVDSKTYSAKYNLSDTALTVSDIGITVSEAKDLAGNTMRKDSSHENIFTIDTQKPTLSISKPSLRKTINSPVVYAISIADSIGIENFDISPSQVIITGTKTAQAQVNTRKIGNRIDVILDSFQGVGYISIQIPAGVGSDLGGNQNTISAISEPFLVQRRLSVQAEDKIITYGDPVPNLTYTVAGFVGTDNVDSLDLKPILKSNAIQFGCPSNGYHINYQSRGMDEFYVLDTIPGVMTFIKKEITAEADHKQMIYGDPVPEFTFKFSNDFVNGDNRSVINLLPIPGSIVTPKSSSGEYEINFDSQIGADDCYQILLDTGLISVLPAPLHLSIKDKHHVYTTQPDTIPFEYEVDAVQGFRNTDTFDSLQGEKIFYPDGEGYEYKVYIQDISSINYIISMDTATLTLHDPTAISLQPNDWEQCAFGDLQFIVEGKGDFDVSYLWEYRTNPSGTFEAIDPLLGIIGTQTNTIYADSIFESWNGYEFRARVSSDFGPEVFSDVVTLIIPDSPPAVYIDTKGSNMLVAAFTDPRARFQWKKNGQIIEGATKQFYYVNEVIDVAADLYSVIVCYEDGCCTETEFGYVTIPPFEEEEPPTNENNISISIGPNPNNGSFNAIWTSGYLGLATIQLVNVFGDQLIKESIEKTSASFSYSVNLIQEGINFSPGIHFLVITYQGKVSSQKIFIRP